MGRLSSDGLDAVLVSKLKLMLERTLSKQPSTSHLNAGSQHARYASFVQTLDPECDTALKCVELLVRETRCEFASRQRRQELAQYDAVIARARNTAAAASRPDSAFAMAFGGPDDDDEYDNERVVHEDGTVTYHIQTDHPELFGGRPPPAYVNPRDVSRTPSLSGRGAGNSRGARRVEQELDEYRRAQRAGHTSNSSLQRYPAYEDSYVPFSLSSGRNRDEERRLIEERRQQIQDRLALRRQQREQRRGLPVTEGPAYGTISATGEDTSGSDSDSTIITPWASRGPRPTQTSGRRWQDPRPDRFSSLFAPLEPQPLQPTATIQSAPEPPARQSVLGAGLLPILTGGDFADLPSVPAPGQNAAPTNRPGEPCDDDTGAFGLPGAGPNGSFWSADTQRQGQLLRQAYETRAQRHQPPSPARSQQQQSAHSAWSAEAGGVGQGSQTADQMLAAPRQLEAGTGAQDGPQLQPRTSLRRNFSIRRSGFHLSSSAPASSSTALPPYGDNVSSFVGLRFGSDPSPLAAPQADERYSTATLANQVARANVNPLAGGSSPSDRDRADFEAHTDARRAARRAEQETDELRDDRL